MDGSIYIDVVETYIKKNNISHLSNSLKLHASNMVLHGCIALQDEYDHLYICNTIKNIIFSKEINVEDDLLYHCKEIVRTLNRIQDMHESILVKSALITGSDEQDRAASMAYQLNSEIRKSKTINILCSFIKSSGFKLIKDSLVVANKNGCDIRIMTTTYMGATDSDAIAELNEFDNIKIKISYDTKNTRLHAKAYMFIKTDEYSTGFIGSSNLSKPALSTGLEWNTRISEFDQPLQWNSMLNSFNDLWDNGNFELYTYKDFKKLDRNLKKNIFQHIEKTFNEKDSSITYHPYPFQSKVLEKIKIERENNKTKHLIVLATGTGKTMLVAFDFARFRKEFIDNNSREPRFLFMVHRKEILEQAKETFANVLGEVDFGVLKEGKLGKNENYNNLFISIRSCELSIKAKTIKKNYDYVVIDEFHHAAADTYKTVIDYYKDSTIIGLTATPERSDGKDILELFNNEITYEIRLSEAINKGFLSSFCYYGLDDSIDYRNIKMSDDGTYNITELGNLLNQNNIRANEILRKTREKVDVNKVKAIGFCVSKVHAEFMCDYFNKSGIKSITVNSDSPRQERDDAKNKIESGEANFVFVVDLYNEGVDIPCIDTVLFLRPTNSLTVFIQQLGRGLRLYEDKEYLTVLDFIGQHNTKYRLDRRFNELIDRRKANVKEVIEKKDDEVDNYLPLGCKIILDKKAKSYILENIENYYKNRVENFKYKIKNFKYDTSSDLTYNNFFNYHKIHLGLFYSVTTWQDICIKTNIIDNLNESLSECKSFLKLISHIDDINYINTILKCISGDILKIDLDDVEQHYLSMLFKEKKIDGIKINNIDKGLKIIRKNKLLIKEMKLLFNYKKTKSHDTKMDSKLSLEGNFNLRLHCSYTRNEIFSVFNKDKDLSLGSNWREGITSIHDKGIDLIFVTLKKNNVKDSIDYNDRFTSNKEFIWETPNTSTQEKGLGLRITKNKSRKLLFVREEKNINSYTNPFIYMGMVETVNYRNNKPVEVIFKLNSEIPKRLEYMINIKDDERVKTG